MDLAGKKLLVLGLGRSGAAAARLVLSRGAAVTIWERQENGALQSTAGEMRALGASVVLNHPQDRWDAKFEGVVVSPGVPWEHPVCVQARQANAPVWSEIEWAARLFSGSVVAVTGTCGKSTTTSFLAHLLIQAGRDAAACGNIGLPFSQVVWERRALAPRMGWAVVETSSFQLEAVDQFHPHVAVLLNIRADHLDRHGDAQTYCRAKARIFQRQDTSDFLIANAQDPTVVKTVQTAQSQVRLFRTNAEESMHVAVGRELASILGLPAHALESARRTFKSLPHRFEIVADIMGVRFINDSKATNPFSAGYGLQRAPAPVIWIAGGRDKNNDFRVMRPSVAGKVKQLVVLGEAAQKIADSFSDLVPVSRVQTVVEAFQAACQTASSGDCVLFSPACASFDQFRNFEERGDHFRALVEKWKRSAAVSSSSFSV